VNRSQFRELIRAFLARARPGRHLYIWYGDAAPLWVLLPPSHVQRLDLFTLVSNHGDLPTADDEARSALIGALSRALDGFVTETNEPQIIVVTGTVLLARYNAAQVFFDFVSDRNMVVLQVDDIQMDQETLHSLPGYVHFKAMADLEALRLILERPENLITED
jgi:hypothetical protein